jgi:mannose/cellobiose epimerase-like protein (N-acyl-D-glucosamine 2-epimerase family)
MVMFEAARRKDEALLDRAAAMFKRHVEVAWDDVYGGFFRALDHIDDYRWKTDKVLWLQEEVLIGTLFLIERRNDAWAREWFAKTYGYVREKYPLKPHGHALWIVGADRKVTYEEKASRVENFHHPRHLMLNLLALERMS